MVASKEMLPQSTERIVEVTGQPEGVRIAVQEIAKCLIDDWDRSQGTVLYHPGAEGLGGGAGASAGPQGQHVPQQQQQQQGNGYPQQQGQFGAGQPRQPRGAPMGGAPGQGQQQQQQQGGGFRNGAQGGPGPRRQSGSGGAGQGQQGGFAPGQSLAGTVVGNESDPNWREQKISIPSDMVGCIIGRGGTKINEIRRLSGSRINIAKTAHDETGERMFVISGLPECVLPLSARPFPSRRAPRLMHVRLSLAGTTRRRSSCCTTSSSRRRSAACRASRRSRPRSSSSSSSKARLALARHKPVLLLDTTSSPFSTIHRPSPPFPRPRPLLNSKRLFLSPSSLSLSLPLSLSRLASPRLFACLSPTLTLHPRPDSRLQHPQLTHSPTCPTSTPILASLASRAPPPSRSAPPPLLSLPTSKAPSRAPGHTTSQARAVR